MRKLLLDNLPQKILALALAVALVMVNREDQIATVTATVRVRVTYPEGVVLVSPLVDKLKVTIEGKYGQLRDFDVEQLPPLDIPLSGLEGEQVAFEPEMFTLPPGLRVQSVRPGAMVVRFEEKRRVTAQVEARFEGEPAPGYRVTDWTVEPATVTVEGAKSAVEGMRKAFTDKISLVGRNQTTTLAVPLAPPPAFVGYLGGNQRYQVTVRIEERRGTRVMTGRPIEVVGAPEDSPGYEVSPETVSITLAGPVRLLDALDPALLEAYVDVSDVRPSAKVVKGHPVAFVPPEGLTVTELNPDKVTLLKRDPPPPPPPPAVDAGVGVDGGVE